MDVTLSGSCCDVPWPGLCARHKEGSTRRLGRETSVGELRAACAPGTPSPAGRWEDAGQVPLRLGACLLAGDTVCWPSSCPIKLGPWRSPTCGDLTKGNSLGSAHMKCHNPQGEVTEGRGAGWSAQGWRRGGHRPGATHACWGPWRGTGMSLLPTERRNGARETESHGQP